MPKEEFKPLKYTKVVFKERQEGGIYSKWRTRLKMASKERRRSTRDEAREKMRVKNLKGSRNRPVVDEEEASSPGESGDSAGELVDLAAGYLADDALYV